MQSYDFVVIGGGIVGLSVAWAIMQRNPGARLAVLEKEDEWTRHQTEATRILTYTVFSKVLGSKQTFTLICACPKR
jgi:glycine/D-amino acid oxidase-like deaminating enzyme